MSHLSVAPPPPQVCLFNLLFVLCVAMSLPCRGWRPLLSGVCTVWTCVLTVCKMLYQLNAVQPVRYSSNCTLVTMTTCRMSVIWLKRYTLLPLGHDLTSVDTNFQNIIEMFEEYQPIRMLYFFLCHQLSN